MLLKLVIRDSENTRGNGKWQADTGNTTVYALKKTVSKIFGVTEIETGR